MAPETIVPMESSTSTRRSSAALYSAAALLPASGSACHSICAPLKSPFCSLFSIRATIASGLSPSTLPTGRTPSLVAELAPGLTNNTPNVNQVTISGAVAYDNVFLLDGVDIGDNLFARPDDLFIEEAIEETQVLTSSVSAGG